MLSVQFGAAQGQAFESRLGYNIDNWRDLKKEIEDNIDVYPATKKGTTKYGDRYEQKNDSLRQAQ